MCDILHKKTSVEYCMCIGATFSVRLERRVHSAVRAGDDDQGWQDISL